jgi:uncharacterized 2Fe-2S/4Fe-4S cluster protein (DUF4445 family)
MPTGKDPKIIFSPSGKRGQFPAGTSLLQAARKLGVDIDSVCGGRGTCGRCQVTVSEGEFSKHGIVSNTAHLSDQNEAESRSRDKRKLREGHRLSCQTQLLGDIAIDVPSTSQIHRQLVCKDHEARAISINPSVHAFFVEVARPSLTDPTGDLERLMAALEKDWQLSNLVCDLAITRSLPEVLRTANWQVTVAVRGSTEIVAVSAGLKESLYGVAIDVGSTTIAAHLCDLSSGEVLASAGRMNPQIRYGEDLMSRVSYIMLNSGGEAELIKAVRGAISELLIETTAKARLRPLDIVEIVIVGNPIMQHLVLGLNPIHLGTAPFTLTSDAATSVRARDIGIDISPGGYGHVGADAAAVLLAEAPYDRDEISLLIDVGTNAEIFLGNRDRILAASSPTGPAFEGAQISSGQRAAPGAVERVRIDHDTLEPRFKVVGCDVWSDDAAFNDQLPVTGVSGICGSGIIEAVAELFLAGVVNAEGVITPEAAARSKRIVRQERTFTYILVEGEPGVRIEQNDIRAIQLAKAALYAGVRLLMDKLGVTRVQRIRLAGAFGANIDVKYAMILGMIPDCDLSNVSSAGNAAGTGARIALLDRHARQLIEQQVRAIEKIETAAEDSFQDHYVSAMGIPHQFDPFTELRKLVEVPITKPATTGRRRRKRTR